MLAGCAIVAWPVSLRSHRPSLLFVSPCLTRRFDPDIYLNRAVSCMRAGKRSGPWCSGSAVQLRHYPVTVSAESKAGLYAATGRRSSGKVGQAQSMRKSGDRPGSPLGQNQGAYFLWFSIAVFRSRWEDRRERAPAKSRLVDAFPVCEFSCRFLLRVFLRS